MRLRRVRRRNRPRFQLGDLLSHGVAMRHTAEIGAGGDGAGSQDDGPAEGSQFEHVGLGHESGGVESAGDAAHGLLRVVAAVAQAVGCSGKKLELTKPFVSELGGLFWRIQWAAI